MVFRKQIISKSNKTKYIVIRPNQHDYEEKCFGIFLDENLSWKYDIAHVNKWISSALLSTKQVNNILPKDFLGALYFSLLYSHICYGILTWGNYNIKTLHCTALLQKRVIQTITNAIIDLLFKATGIIKITDQYIFQSRLFIFAFITKYIPYSFEQMFRFNHDIPNWPAIRQSDLLHETRCTIHFTIKLPLYSILKIWNK